MGDKIPSGRAAILVESLDGARPIIVERSMYLDNRGAGTDTIGGSRTRLEGRLLNTGARPHYKR